MTIICIFISKAKLLQKGSEGVRIIIYIITYQPFLVSPSSKQNIFFPQTSIEKQNVPYFFSLHFFFSFYKSEFRNGSMQILNSTMLTDRNSRPTGRLSTKSRNKRSQFPMQVIKILRGYLQYEKCTKWPFTQ